MIPFGDLFLHGFRDDNLVISSNQVVRLVRELVALGGVKMLLLWIDNPGLKLLVLSLLCGCTLVGQGNVGNVPSSIYPVKALAEKSFLDRCILLKASAMMLFSPLT